MSGKEDSNIKVNESIQTTLPKKIEKRDNPFALDLSKIGSISPISEQNVHPGQGGYNMFSCLRRRASNPISTGALNNKRYSDYQKLWGESLTPHETSNSPILSDILYVCTFCSEPISPRRKVNIIKKTAIIEDFINNNEREKGTLETIGDPGIPTVEYCCSICSNKIRSFTTNSPRRVTKAPSSPCFTPRPSQRTKMMQRSLSKSKKFSLSWSGSLESSPERKIDLSDGSPKIIKMETDSSRIN